MTTTPKTDALISTLTPDHARLYAAETDKLMWIETTLLDPAGISRHQAERVEDALLAILEIEEQIKAGKLVRFNISLEEIKNVFKSGCGGGDEQFDYVCHAIVYDFAFENNLIDCWTRFCSDKMTAQFRDQWLEKITMNLEYVEPVSHTPTFGNNSFLKSWVLATKYQRAPDQSHRDFRISVLEQASQEFPDVEFEFLFDVTSAS